MSFNLQKMRESERAPRRELAARLVEAWDNLPQRGGAA